MLRHGWKFLVLILVGLIVFAWLVKAPVMSSYITEKMGIPVNIGSIGMWPSKTVIHRFTIDNPFGFSHRKAFKADDIVIKYRFGSLTAEPSEIDLIVLDGVYLNIELRDKSGKDNNWAAIAAQMPEHKSNKRVIIHKLIIRNMTVETQGAGANALGISGTRHFDEMEFNEIDSADGFPTKELISRIFQDVGLMQYIQNLIKPVQQIQKALSPLKLFGN